MKTRLLFIDNLKGFAILLVVLGHVIQFNILDYDNNIVFRLIYSFHMPLFFVMSGYVSFKENIQIRTVIYKRAYQLLLPYFVWGVGGVILGKEKMTFQDLLTDVDKFLWFLWVLFFVNIITIILDKFLGSSRHLAVITIGILLLMMGLSKILNVDVMGVKLICYHAHFFMAGYLARKFSVEKIACFRQLAIVLPLYFLMIPFWFRNNDIIIGGVLLNSVLSLLYRIVVAYLACYSLYLVFRKFVVNRNLLTIFGASTLGIYASHFCLLSYLPDTVWLPLLFILVSFLSLFFVEIVRKSNYLRPLIGEKIE